MAARQPMIGTVRGLRQTRPMSELAYMVREDWGQRGTAMRQQSAVIRDWLGHPPYVVATADRKKYESDNSADREFVTYVAHAATDRNVIDLSNLNGLRRGDKTLTRPLIVLHPYEEQDCDLLREIVALESVARLFVIVWSPRDLVRTWLDGLGAVNLHTRSALGAPDVVQLEAAKCWVDEQYKRAVERQRQGCRRAAIALIQRGRLSAQYRHLVARLLRSGR